MTDILTESSRYIAGGVVSINRKIEPVIQFASATGSRLRDVQGREYLDYHAAFAPHVLGHNHPGVNAAVVDAITRQESLMGSGPTEWEITLARQLTESVPSLDLVQITNTGSEATAHAIRLARAWTGREDIILTLGGYNGWHNDVSRAVMPSLAQVGPRVSPGEYRFIPSSAGVPEGTQRRVHLVNYNDLASVEYVLRRYPVACVMTEPALQNIGVVPPQPGYLEGLKTLCAAHGALLVFDEVKTGFRCALGGFQSRSGVLPDLSTFGKALANGYPLGVIGGRRDVMELFAHPDPARRVLIAGTYNAHPFTTAAATATIDILRGGGVYERLEALGARMQAGLEAIFAEQGVTAVVSRIGSAFCYYFMDHVPVDWHDILEHHDFARDTALRHALVAEGIYFFPAACKQSSISLAHTEEDIDHTLATIRRLLPTIAAKG